MIEACAGSSQSVEADLAFRRWWAWSQTP